MPTALEGVLIRHTKSTNISCIYISAKQSTDVSRQVVFLLANQGETSLDIHHNSEMLTETSNSSLNSLKEEEQSLDNSFVTEVMKPQTPPLEPSCPSTPPYYVSDIFPTSPHTSTTPDKGIQVVVPRERNSKSYKVYP